MNFTSISKPHGLTCKNCVGPSLLKKKAMWELFFYPALTE